MAPLVLIALLIIASATFAIALAALLSAQLVRRRRRLRSTRAEVTVESVLNSQQQPDSLYLNYFLFWKNQVVRVEPAPPSLYQAKEKEEGEEDVVAKWQAMNGGSRFLYTIKEEDREGEYSVESADESIKEVITSSSDVLTVSVVNEEVAELISDDDDDDDLCEEYISDADSVAPYSAAARPPAPNNN